MKIRKILVWSSIGILSAGFSLLLWTNKFALYDWYVLRSYAPATQITDLATKSGMNEEGTRIFYAHQPRITNQEEFNSVCTVGEETIVLGCYTGYDFAKDTDIYIYNVEKPELNGVLEVTAAHEMLHAAYDRLSRSERQRVDVMTATMVKKINNPRISKLIEGYQERDPASVPNELHSILATEIASLDPALEDYYSRYFEDRQKVVDLSEQYESVFETAKNEAQRLSGELSLRKSEIGALESQIETDYNNLLAARKKLDTLKARNDIPGYNAAVPEFNQLVSSYNQEVAAVKRLIDEYNRLVASYNEKVGQQQELVNSIDSKYQPVN